MTPRKKQKKTAEPTFDFSKSTGRGATGLARALEITRAAKRGKPKVGQASVATKPRSIRLPDDVWLKLEEVASKQHVARHDLVKRIIVDWLQEAAASGRKR
jgi:hypothetical protein